jgi:hypothetical protein
MMPSLSRRTLLKRAALAGALLGLPAPLLARGRKRRDDTGLDPDRERFAQWTGQLFTEGLTSGDVTPGHRAVRVGELAAGSPYVAGTLDAYLLAGGPPPVAEPLALSLTKFDCVTLVESCLAVSRVAAAGGPPSWDRFAAEVERMRYRGGVRGRYASRLHYFSEWIRDGAARGLVRDLGADLGGVRDARPLRFMTAHRASYPGLARDEVFAEIAGMERGLDANPRWVVPAARLAAVGPRLATGDVLAFATAIDGLDVTHAALAYRDSEGVLRVLHAPLSGGVVEVTAATLIEYVAAIRRCTGVLVARPL